jgi:hypothetical protein
MKTMFNRVKIFKWIAVFTFFGSFFATLGSAFSTSNAATTWQNWAVATIMALGAACVTTGALFIQLDKKLENEEGNVNPKKDPI